MSARAQSPLKLGCLIRVFVLYTSALETLHYAPSAAPHRPPPLQQAQEVPGFSGTSGDLDFFPFFFRGPGDQLFIRGSCGEVFSPWKNGENGTWKNEEVSPIFCPFPPHFSSFFFLLETFSYISHDVFATNPHLPPFSPNFPHFPPFSPIFPYFPPFPPIFPHFPPFPPIFPIFPWRAVASRGPGDFRGRVLPRPAPAVTGRQIHTMAPCQPPAPFHTPWQRGGALSAVCTQCNYLGVWPY